LAKITKTTIERPFTRNVCALPFVPGEAPQVILLHHKTNEGVRVYDGFGGRITHSPADALCGHKSCSEYIHESLGVLTRPEDWTEIVTLRGEDWEVTFFFLVLEAFRNAKSLRQEQDVSVEDPLGTLPLNIIPSLRWLIPLALDENVVKPLGLSGINL
jgi:hypothetical protein